MGGGGGCIRLNVDKYMVLLLFTIRYSNQKISFLIFFSFCKWN